MASFGFRDTSFASAYRIAELDESKQEALAAEVIALKAHAINPRGELYTQENIKQRLEMRDFNEELRSIGQLTGGPSAFGQKDKQLFANALDRFLAKYKN